MQLIMKSAKLIGTESNPVTFYCNATERTLKREREKDMVGTTVQFLAGFCAGALVHLSRWAAGPELPPWSLAGHLPQMIW
jgi:hypothetical protein